MCTICCYRAFVRQNSLDRRHSTLRRKRRGDAGGTVTSVSHRSRTPAINSRRPPVAFLASRCKEFRSGERNSLDAFISICAMTRPVKKTGPLDIACCRTAQVLTEAPASFRIPRSSAWLTSPRQVGTDRHHAWSPSADQIVDRETQDQQALAKRQHARRRLHWPQTPGATTT